VGDPEPRGEWPQAITAIGIAHHAARAIGPTVVGSLAHAVSRYAAEPQGSVIDSQMELISFLDMPLGPTRPAACTAAM
jgi:hypothetical protein